MEHIPFKKVTLSEAKAALDGDSAPKKKVDWEQVRRPQSPRGTVLTDFSVRWLFQLPKEILPKTLAREYPRIINRIADLWENPEACVKYLDELLMDDRGTRQGFPKKIVFELTRMKVYLAPPEE